MSSPTPEQSFSQLPDQDLEAIGRQCEFEYCRQLDFLPFRCESCRGARPASTAAVAQAEKAKSAFARLRAWGKEKSASLSPKAKAKSTAQKLVTLNALKRTAKGDSKVALDKRMYVHVEASSDTTSAKYPKGNFFFDKNWSMGKVLDDAAKRLQVQNVNNGLGAGKVSQGDTLVLLRGIGPPVPDLIQLE
ncbi:hypothetical protein KEM54_005909 [Ascosphaera aggregata]|nr:hypothetical protein KEM54_005909 [Ascosphaera aggregata]